MTQDLYPANFRNNLYSQPALRVIHRRASFDHQGLVHAPSYALVLRRRCAALSRSAAHAGDRLVDRSRIAAAPALRWRAARWLVPCVLGFAWTWLRVDIRLHERWPAALAGRTVVVEGVVAAQPCLGRGLAMRAGRKSVDSVARSVRARLTGTNRRSLPQPGERWRLRARACAHRAFANPGGFDYEGWLFREGVDATGYVLADPGNARIAGTECAVPVARVACRNRTAPRGHCRRERMAAS